MLVGCCPGGTASNVVALIARADVALSVVVTTMSTVLVVVLTPLLSSALAGRYVPVDGWTLLLSVVQVVLLPVAVGVALKLFWPRPSERVETVMPTLTVVAIALIVGSIVGSQREALASQLQPLLLADLLLHLGGFVLGSLTSGIARGATAGTTNGQHRGGYAELRPGGDACPSRLLQPPDGPSRGYLCRDSCPGSVPACLAVCWRGPAGPPGQKPLSGPVIGTSL